MVPSGWGVHQPGERVQKGVLNRRAEVEWTPVGTKGKPGLVGVRETPLSRCQEKNYWDHVFVSPDSGHMAWNRVWKWTRIFGTGTIRQIHWRTRCWDSFQVTCWMSDGIQLRSRVTRLRCVYACVLAEPRAPKSSAVTKTNNQHWLRTAGQTRTRPVTQRSLVWYHTLFDIIPLVVPAVSLSIVNRENKVPNPKILPHIHATHLWH